MAGDETAYDLDLLAASLRADSSDLGAFVESLAAKLEEALPGRVQVERRRSGVFGPRAVRRIMLDSGGSRLELRLQGQAIETRCSRLSGGIVLKSELVDTDTWLRGLSDALAEEAKRSATTRQVLERLLIR